MPAVAGLAEMFAAAVALLFAIGAWVLLKAIGSGLPNFSVLGVGINIGHWFENLANHVANWIVNTARGQWAFMRDMFNVTAWLFDHAFNATANAISHAFDYADHIVTVVIPHAVAGGVADARHTAHDLFNTAEADIGSVAGRVDTLVTRTVPHAITTAEDYTDKAISDLHRKVDRAIADAINGVESDLHDVKTTLTRSIGSLADTVAADFVQAKAIAQADATAALNTATDLIGQAKTEIENVAQADANKVQALLQTAIDSLTGTVTNLTGTVAQDLTAAEQYAKQQVADGVQAVTNQLASTAASLQASISAAAAAATAGIQHAVETAQQDATAALGTAEGAVAGALGDIYTDLTGKALAYNGDLASIAGSLGLALAGSIAGVVARVATLEKCSVGVCETSPNNFGKLLKDALGIAEFAGVGGFLTELIDNPKAAEQKYADVIAGTVTTGQHAFDALLSL